MQLLVHVTFMIASRTWIIACYMVITSGLLIVPLEQVIIRPHEKLECVLYANHCKLLVNIVLIHPIFSKVSCTKGRQVLYTLINPR